MQMVDLLNSVRYITDENGNKTGVLVEMELWQRLIQFVQKDEEHEHPQSSQSVHVQAVDSPPKLQDDTDRAEAMAREEAAFHRLHPTLRKEHSGRFVAIYKEELIDSDMDQTALYRRVSSTHPGKIVWIAPVNEDDNETFVFRSPRLVDHP